MILSPLPGLIFNRTGDSADYLSQPKASLRDTIVTESLKHFLGILSILKILCNASIQR